MQCMVNMVKDIHVTGHNDADDVKNDADDVKKHDIYATGGHGP